jgi:hypothetical protein
MNSICTVVYVACVTLCVEAIVVDWESAKMGKQGTTGRKKHVTLTVPHKLEIIRRRESGKSWRNIMAHTVGEHKLSMV